MYFSHLVPHTGGQVGDGGPRLHQPRVDADPGPNVGMEVAEHLARHEEAEVRPLSYQPHYPALVLGLRGKYIP